MDLAAPKKSSAARIADRGLRSRVVIATKTGLEWKDGKVFRNASRDRILREVENSLRRLRTDYIDIYQVHWPDPLVPIEETAEAMQTLFDQGKIRAIGVSNFSVAQIERFRRVAKLHVVQPPYNLFEREIEDELLPYCRQSGLATLTYGALCRGLLSGKLQEDAHFEGDDLRLTDPKFQPPRYRSISLRFAVSINSPGSRYGKRVIHWLCAGSSTRVRRRHCGERVIPASCSQSTRYSDGRSMPPQRQRSIVSCGGRSPIRSARNSWRRRRARMPRSSEAAQ